MRARTWTQERAEEAEPLLMRALSITEALMQARSADAAEQGRRAQRESEHAAELDAVPTAPTNLKGFQRVSESAPAKAVAAAPGGGGRLEVGKGLLANATGGLMAEAARP